MTIRTQDFQIANVGAPVFQAARPRPRSVFRADLPLRVQVVQLKHPNVADPAFDAGTPKAGNNGDLGAPVRFLLAPLVYGVLAFRTAISGDGRLAAAKALAVTVPPACRVAAGGTEPSLFPTGPALLDIERRTARGARPIFAGFGPVRRKPAHTSIPSGRSVAASAGHRAILAARAPGETSAAFGATVLDCFHANILTQGKHMTKPFAIACKRVDEAARQPDLLVPETRPAPVQESLL